MAYPINPNSAYNTQYQALKHYSRHGGVTHRHLRQFNPQFLAQWHQQSNPHLHSILHNNNIHHSWFNSHIQPHVNPALLNGPQHAFGSSGWVHANCRHDHHVARPVDPHAILKRPHHGPPSRRRRVMRYLRRRFGSLFHKAIRNFSPRTMLQALRGNGTARKALKAMGFHFTRFFGGQERIIYKKPRLFKGW